MRTTWLRRIHPALFAVFPILSLGVQNPGRFRARTALLICLVAVAGVALGYVVAYAVARWRRREGAADRAALATFVGVALFYAYPVLRSAYARLRAGGARSPAVAAVVAVVALLAVATWVARRRGWRVRVPSAAGVGRRLSLAGALLVVGALAQLTFVHVRDAQVIARNPLVRELDRPVPLRAGAHARLPKRDIYVVVLDEYASAEVLRERFGFDNRPFEDSLRAIGFTIPTSVRSNYAVTTLSVPSLLNFARMDSLGAGMPSHTKDWAPASYVLEHNRAARFLKGQGYRFLFFPARFFAPTRESAEADEEYDPYTGIDVARATYGSEFAFELVTNTPLARLRPLFRPYTAVRFEHAARTLNGLTTVPRRPGPKFVFAHVLMPHVPFTVDASCRPLANASWDSTDFAGHVQCVNRLTLRAVRSILAQSSTPPIIILQGDHGTQSLHTFDNAPEALTVAQARERFRAFGAYYLPDGGAAAMPDSVSVVNVLRYVFGYYFGADLPSLPDDMYFSSWQYPYALTRVGSDFHVDTSLRTASRPSDGIAR